jgi:bleomycin hydrolase
MEFFMVRIFITLLFCSFFMNLNLLSQDEKRDKGQFINHRSEYWNEIKKAVDEFEKPDKEIKKVFKMDLSGKIIPKSTEEFNQQWHNEPVSQGWSGMCWNYSTTSMFESEIFRIFGKKIKISELHTTYWEYVEKARGFIRSRGNTLFAEGSEANAVMRIWKQYGCVPAEIFTGLKPNQKHHGHEKMFNEMNDYLQSVKKSNSWNEEIAIQTIKSILNYYLGEPPKEFKYEGKNYTAQQFLKDIVKLNMDDYVDVMSLLQKPYFEKVEYEVPDNWWHNEDYHNVPLDEFMTAIKSAVKAGYTMEIGGDVSEAGYSSHSDVAMIPSFDIPSEYIDENARQFRFSNNTTQDDHGIHIVGYKEMDGDYWFLIKDSGSGARDGANKGYYFYHEDYIKLKMLTFCVHKDAVKDLLKKFK